MANELIEESKKVLKKVADFLEITPTRSEHHSVPYAPYGTPKERLERKEVWGKVSSPQAPYEKPEEWRYINRIETPMRVKHGSLAPPIRNVEGYYYVW